jgi:hypothetical protein
MIRLSRHTRRCISVHWLRSVACDIPVVRLDTRMKSGHPGHSLESEQQRRGLSDKKTHQSGCASLKIRFDADNRLMVIPESSQS